MREEDERFKSERKREMRQGEKEEKRRWGLIRAFQRGR